MIGLRPSTIRPLGVDGLPRASDRGVHVVLPYQAARRCSFRLSSLSPDKWGWWSGSGVLLPPLLFEQISVSLWLKLLKMWWCWKGKAEIAVGQVFDLKPCSKWLMGRGSPKGISSICPAMGLGPLHTNRWQGNFSCIILLARYFWITALPLHTALSLHTAHFCSLVTTYCSLPYHYILLLTDLPQHYAYWLPCH